MRVLHLLASNKYSGAENVVVTIMKNFTPETDMVYCSPIGDIQTILAEKNINYLPLKKMSIKEIKRAVKEYKPDIIHAHDYKASVLAAYSGFKGKIISHLHNNTLFAKKWNFKTISYAISIPRFQKIVGVSESVFNEAIFQNQMKNKFTILYNFVDAEEVINKSNQYNWQKPYDLFFFGRLTEQKDPITFINIVNQLKQQNPKISAVMIGDGELRKTCEKYIRELQLIDTIDMLGFVENPFPIIKNSAIQIMPSKYEGFGLVAIESMILNKPVLNSGVGGLGEIFQNNPEFICHAEEQYVEKILNNIWQEQTITAIIIPYTIKEKWKQQIKKIYHTD